MTARDIDPGLWTRGRYKPTPTIVEAATALYNGHSVDEILRRDASATNLSDTSDAISEIVRRSMQNGQKSICFVTGVPGSGKTLVGLNIATAHIDRDNELYSVFLSGNGPLVAILREALTRDKVRSEKEQGRRVRKGDIMREVKLFVQNVHDFRDESRPRIWIDHPSSTWLSSMRRSGHGIVGRPLSSCNRKGILRDFSSPSPNSSSPAWIAIVIGRWWFAWLEEDKRSIPGKPALPRGSNACRSSFPDLACAHLPATYR